MATDRGFYLTDGGLETTLLFHHEVDLRHFAAFELIEHPRGKKVFLKYYHPYLRLASRYRLNYILETPTWRASTDWGFKLGYTLDDLIEVNRKSVRILREISCTATGSISKILISGNIGPRRDGYRADNQLTHRQAKAYHQTQVNTFAEENVDLVTGMTINYSDEAIGIIHAARDAGVPAVVSFTVETDGCLPDGETLRDAIERTDQLTGAYALYFMINCAHPHHFKNVLLDPGKWKERIRGIRANASTKSHAELDGSKTLDAGDKCHLAVSYGELMSLLPNLRVIGGCCGTDHSHMEAICDRLFGETGEIAA